MKPAAWKIVENVPGAPLLIRDVGPWDQRPTVTNNAEHVVRVLVAQGLLPPGRELHYFDSEGELAGIEIRDGRFAGFYFP